jgi:hypothetical protein
MKTLLCPCCKANLVNGPIRTLMGVLDEEFKSPTFLCPNTNCEASKATAFWDMDGDLYFETYSRAKHTIPWIDGLSEAFGGYWRKIRAQSKMESESKKKLFTFPCWPLKKWECWSNWTYTADDDGKFVSRRFHWQWVRPDGCIHMWGMRMLKYEIGVVWKSWRDLRRGKKENWKSDFAKNRLQDMVKRREWPNPEWWRYCGAWLAEQALKYS